MNAAPRYPEFDLRSTDEAVIALPSEPVFNCFQRDAVGVQVRSELAPTSPGRPPRVVEVLFVVSCREWEERSEHDRLELARGQLDLGVKYRTATVS